MLTVTTPATDRLLLTLAEIQSATGVTGASYNTELASLNARVASTLARECCIPVSGVNPPTFRVETLTEVFRVVIGARYLPLSRWPVTSITSVVVDGSTLDAANYETDEAAGWLYRLASDELSYWSATKITVVYVAGWATVPDDLKLAASKLARMLWAEDGPNARTDPNLKRQRIEGVGEREWWVPPPADELLSSEIKGLIGPYRHRAI
jgi:hypothetical protein